MECTCIELCQTSVANVILFLRLIYFLYESWTNSCCNTDLNCYICHNFYRKFQHRNARRSSGGIVLLYKDYLKDGIEIIKNRYDTVIWLKLDKVFFNVDEDIYVCGTYIWGADSPVYNTLSVDLFDVLEQDILLQFSWLCCCMR